MRIHAINNLKTVSRKEYSHIMNSKAEQTHVEKRNEYYVHPLLKRLWAVQLDILKEIDRICKQHNIKYYGWFGTLLGAIRHHGFIPWDDDLDLTMFRDDYERFRYYAKTELPEEWRIVENDPSLISIFHTDKIQINQEFLDKFHGCPFITGIDIFSLDYIPQNEADKELQLNLFRATRNLCLNWDLPDNDEQWKDTNKWEYLDEIERLTGHHFDRLNSVKEQLYFIGDRIAAMYWNSDSGILTNMFWMYDHPNYRIPRSCFDKIIEVPFENTILPIPENYDFICKLIYGKNYTTPIKKCEHDYLNRQVEHLRNCFSKSGRDLPSCWDITLSPDSP